MHQKSLRLYFNLEKMKNFPVTNVVCLLVWIQLQFLWNAATVQGSPLGSLTEVEEYYVFAGRRVRPLSVFCSVPAGVSPSTVQWELNGNTIQADGIKYTIVSNTELQLNELVGSDEGVYSCSFLTSITRYSTDIACIYVLGKAEFVSGGDSTCNVSALSGDNVELDTRVQYIGGGPSQQTQTISLLQLFKHNDETGANDVVYFCANNNVKIPCSSKDKFLVVEGSHKFDIRLLITNASPSDAGYYVARVEVLNPGVSSRSYIKKSFRVNVREPLSISVSQGPSSSSAVEHFIQCQVQLASEYQPDQVHLEWTDSLGNNINDTTGVSLQTEASAERIVTTAVFDTSAVRQGSEFFCNALLNQQGKAIPLTQAVGISIELPVDNSTNNEVYFQVCIGPVSSHECSIWFDSVQSSNMDVTIRKGIALAASAVSGSEISYQAFNTGRMRCRGPGNWLCYRSSIEDTEAHSKVETVGFIEQWVGGLGNKPTIELGLFYLNVNSLCDVRISSLTDPWPDC